MGLHGAAGSGQSASKAVGGAMQKTLLRPVCNSHVSSTAMPKPVQRWSSKTPFYVIPVKYSQNATPVCPPEGEVVVL